MTTTLSPQVDVNTLKAGAVETLRALYFNRMVDEKCSKLVKQSKGGTFFLSSAGHEMIGVLCGLHLKKGCDWAFPYYRDRPCVIGMGAPVEDLIASAVGRVGDHHSGGRMMPEHFSHKELRIGCQSSVVGSQVLHAVGMAKAIAMDGRDEIVYVSCGDGATSQGDFHEAINFSIIHKLPIVFVVQDNGWAISVPQKEQTAGGDVVEHLRGYSGLETLDVDGADFESSRVGIEKAYARARTGNGPSVIVARVPRLGAHSNSDDPRKYRNEQDLQDVAKLDPIPRFETYLIEQGLMDDSEIDRLRSEVSGEVEDASSRALGRPVPDASTVEDHVFKPFEVERGLIDRGEPVVMVDAINHAIAEEMERDQGVVVFGQDVAHGKGGVFGVTRGLTEKFGNRCFNTPLAESTIVGMALGMALDGRCKPVAEIQFADYIWTSVNQLFNELSSIHYRSNGVWNCPVVLRMPCGGYIQGGPYHSQSIEAYLAHTPGLKVVIPSNALDAKRLMKTAIRDPNPVLFLEHKGLYRQRAFCAREESGKDELLPFGQAKVVKEGSDLTFIGYGMMIPMAIDIANKMMSEGISVEVIDLRTLVPLDMETIKTSVEKTGKVLIAHEANKSCGFGAEIAARITEEAFTSLDAPIARIGALSTPVPYAKSLEEVMLPSKCTIAKGIRDLHAY